MNRRDLPLDTNKWSKYTYTPEQGPRSRHFHTTVLYKNQMILFGGKNNSYLNDLWQFDLGEFLFLGLIFNVFIYLNRFKNMESNQCSKRNPTF